MGVKIINGTTMNDAVASFRLTNNSTASRVVNLAALQAKIDSGAPVYPYFFPGAASGTGGFWFSDTIQIPAASGMAWHGVGGADSPSGIGGGPGYGSRINLYALDGTGGGNYNDVNATRFDGSTKKLTSSGAGTTMIVTGRATVLLTDKYNSVYITGGAGVLRGWYGIVDVSEGISGVGTWTLDRAWCTGTVTDGTGFYCPAIVHDKSWGLDLQGLIFSFRQFAGGSSADGNGSVCYHIATQSTSGSANGKQRFTNCSFAYADVGVLNGRFMANAFPDRRARGSLTTRTDADTGEITMSTQIAPHGITTGEIVDVVWSRGWRLGMTVGTVSGNSVPIDGGEGDDLPTVASAQVFIPQTIARGTITKTDADTGTITASTSAHGIETGNKVDVRWVGGRRTRMTVGTVSGVSIPIDGGDGDDLPTTGTNVIVPIKELVVSGSTQNFVGVIDNNCDHGNSDHCYWNTVAACFMYRTQQSAGHYHSDLSVSGLSDSVFRCDAGGPITAVKMKVAGTSGTQNVLRLGRDVGSSNSQFAFNDVWFDGGSNCRNPQLVVSDWYGSEQRATVSFTNVHLGRAEVNDDFPLVDIQGRIKLRLRDIDADTVDDIFGIWPNSLWLRNGKAATDKPHVLVEGCTLDVASASAPEEIIDEDHCDAGIIVRFVGNCLPNGSDIPDKTYTTTGPP
jgi:hypothetical protein